MFVIIHRNFEVSYHNWKVGGPLVCLNIMEQNIYLYVLLGLIDGSIVLLENNSQLIVSLTHAHCLWAWASLLEKFWVCTTGQSKIKWFK